MIIVKIEIADTYECSTAYSNPQFYLPAICRPRPAVPGIDPGRNTAETYFIAPGGETSRRIYFINKGFARAYYVTRQGRECTSWFMGQGDLMISVYSFYTQKPAAENIELLSISWNQLQGIYADFPEYNYTGRLVTEKYYMLSEERTILLRTLSARERYERLLQLHPGITQKASLGQIASYLGMTQETLSRVRGARNILT